MTLSLLSSVMPDPGNVDLAESALAAAGFMVYLEPGRGSLLPERAPFAPKPKGRAPRSRLASDRTVSLDAVPIVVAVCLATVRV